MAEKTKGHYDNILYLIAALCLMLLAAYSRVWRAVYFAFAVIIVIVVMRNMAIRSKENVVIQKEKTG